MISIIASIHSKLMCWIERNAYSIEYSSIKKSFAKSILIFWLLQSNPSQNIRPFIPDQLGDNAEQILTRKSEFSRAFSSVSLTHPWIMWEYHRGHPERQKVFDFCGSFHPECIDHWVSFCLYHRRPNNVAGFSRDLLSAGLFKRSIRWMERKKEGARYTWIRGALHRTTGHWCYRIIMCSQHFILLSKHFCYFYSA